MKDVKQWLSLIENKEIRERALSNFNRIGTKTKRTLDNFKDALVIAFFWEDSREGHDYWMNVADGLIPIPPEDESEHDKDCDDDIDGESIWEFIVPGGKAICSPIAKDKDAPLDSIPDMIEDGLRDGSVWVDQVGGDHYKKLKIQPLEFIIANQIGYLEGNIIKYITRYKDKNGLEDLLKAQQYLRFLIEQNDK